MAVAKYIAGSHPQDDKMVLTLSPEEASVLHEILYRIGGLPDKTPRGIVDRISNAMFIAHGVPQGEYYINPVRDTIEFLTKEEYDRKFYPHATRKVINHG